MRTFVPKCNRVAYEHKTFVKYEPYSSYLESDHWRQTKRKSSRIYGFKCVVCDMPNNIEYHHVHYPNNRTDILAHQVLPLCEDCHKAYHSFAPNGGINTNIKNPSQIDKLIRGVFIHVKIGRRFDKADPKWVNALIQRENKTSKTFRQLESQRHQKRR